MTVSGIFLLGFAPGIFWLWYFYKKDKWEPEPKSLIAKTFLWGMGAAAVAALLEMPFGEYQATSIILLGPIIEELVKFFAVRLTMYHHAEFDEPMDGITYAAAAALGFASIENSFYLLGEYGFPLGDFVASQPSEHSGGLVSLFVLRAILSVPAHVLFSGAWGYALGWSKFMDKSFRWQLITRGYILAVVMHGLFNALAGISSYVPALLIVAVFFMWRILEKRITHALASSPHIIHDDE